MDKLSLGELVIIMANLGILVALWGVYNEIRKLVSRDSTR